MHTVAESKSGTNTAQVDLRRRICAHACNAPLPPSLPPSSASFPLTHAGLPHLSLTHFKENPPLHPLPPPSHANPRSPSPHHPPPSPLKVPFSLVLMADRLWPHSLSAAACPHCVPTLGGGRVWVEDRPALQKCSLTWMYGQGEGRRCRR